MDAHEIWAAAQLVPGEGVEDGVARIENLIAADSRETDRLALALGLLGYRADQPSHYLSNLLHAIALFAGVTGDESLRNACEDRINLIRAENEAHTP